ncbi:phage tail tape measure protein [Bacillus sonorensis]|uniref:phage tail tape measure protein n=1 Tax=Bacillus sonorensis TaxID=119858 RepID=UPI00098B3BD8|nr:phage tail tape measure protein [Bacillus sonorensis]
MKYVAPVANGLGFSMEDTAAAVAKMSDAGIQGSMAGTALRATLLHLSNPVGQTAKAVKKYNLELDDANGNLKPLPELIGYISKNLEGMSDAQKTATAAQLVGTEAASGFVTLLNVGEKGLRDYSDELKNAGGTADRVAKTQMDNLNGSFEEFKSALDGLGIKIGNEFLPTFRKIVDEGTKILGFLNELNPGIITTGLEMAGTAAAIALVSSSIVKLGIALKGLNMTPVGAAITALSLLGGLLVGVKKSYDEMNTVSLETAEAKQKEIEALDKTAAEFDKLQSKTKLTADEFAHYLDLNDRLKTETDPDAIKRIKDEQADLQERSGLTNEEFRRFLKLNGEIVEKAPETNAAISEQGNAFAKNTDAVKKLTEAKAEELRTELEKQKATAQSKEAEYLQKQQNLKTDIKKLDGERAELEGKIADQTQKVKDKTDELNAAKEDGNEKAQYQAEIDLAAEEATLNKLREQLVANLDNLQTKRKSLGEVKKELGKLDEINQKLIDIELQQVGLNAKKGEGVNVLRKELFRLKDVKANLENNTSAADKKTKEYRDSVKAVDKEISQLKSALSRVQDITKEAETMNERLKRRIDKKIHVTYSMDGTEIEETPETFKKTHGKGGREVPFHVGGIVGRGQINKLHTGGLASKFEKAPMSHEVDIRALRNEMVLTEAQQANLMRMIDAGHTAAIEGNPGLSSEVIGILRSIDQGVRQNRNVAVQVSGETIASATYPYVNQKMTGDLKSELRSMGVKE